jgi:diguanylate cyclase (GGDEF)-like protein/PAS domain S-box-containing protein
MNMTRANQAESRLFPLAWEHNSWFFASLLDAIPVPVCYKDIEGRYLGCNAAFELCIGFSLSELKGRCVFDVLPPDQAQRIREYDLDLLQHPGEKVESAQMTFADGMLHDVVLHKALFCDSDGRICGIITAILDISEQQKIHQALQASEQQARELAALLRLMCDNVPDMIWAKDLEQRYVFTNKAMCAKLLNARDTAEPLGKTYAFFSAREQQAHAANPHWHTVAELRRQGDMLAMNRGESVIFESEGYIKGQYTILEVHKAPFCAENGVTIGTVGLARDITARKRAEDQLHLAASVFTHANEGIVILDSDGTILDVNDTFSKITGYARSEVLGLNPETQAPQILNMGFFVSVWPGLSKSGHWSGEFWSRRKSGEVYAEMLTASVVLDGEGKPRQYVALFSDITPLKEHERQLEHLANHDALTSLPNRVLFVDRLRQAMAQTERRSGQLALAYLDLDGFKAVNDRYGHEAGDLLLQSVSARMQQVLRKGDTLARLGGDEFAAVLLDLRDHADSMPILAHLLEAASRPVRLGEIELRVSASIGVTFYPQVPAVDVDQLLRQSDQAMYRAKLSGKDGYRFYCDDLDAGGGAASGASATDA